MIAPARRAAFDTLLRVFEDDAYADRAFPAAAAGLDPRDRALAQRLAYGTIQRVRTLDHGIEALGRRPVAKLDPPVRAALRLGAYQLAFSEVAVHAAVNESVELVRAAGLERAVSFANAVLRRLALGLRDLVD
ncbi:MAG TPA: transcription antitermination protein NusB, partial [Gaiellaceae bacterium]|nr:transcription antitermination protein NusB [Gaiellaceae bacterium]